MIGLLRQFGQRVLAFDRCQRHLRFEACVGFYLSFYRFLFRHYRWLKAPSKLLISLAKFALPPLCVGGQ